MSPVSFFFAGWEPILRIVVVGGLAYIALVVLLRSSGKRTLSQLNSFDFVITVALGATFGRILTAKSVALAEALTAFALLIALQFAVSWLNARSRSFSSLITASPTLLYYRGEVLAGALKSQRLTEDELLAAARKQGLGSLQDAEAVVMEADGRLVIVKSDSTGDASGLRPVIQG
jgi:uncharacterized membrane protein YcaP (DUF421 family)